MPQPRPAWTPQPSADVSPGQRVFDVLLQGEHVGRVDVSAEAGGAGKALVREFTGVRIGGQLAVELRGVNGSALAPVLCGLEAVIE